MARTIVEPEAQPVVRDSGHLVGNSHRTGHASADQIPKDGDSLGTEDVDRGALSPEMRLSTTTFPKARISAAGVATELYAVATPKCDCASRDLRTLPTPPGAFQRNDRDSRNAWRTADALLP